jgi:hypothetical protein
MGVPPEEMAVTEAEWLAATDPQPMLDLLRGRATERKLRLFACGLCRSFWSLLIDERSRVAVETAERLADGLEPSEWTQEVFSEACIASLDVRLGRWRSCETVLPLRRRHEPHQLLLAACMAAFAVGGGTVNVETQIRMASTNSMAGGPTNGLNQAQLLRDIFAGTVRSTPINPEWLSRNDDAIRCLGASIYDDRRFDRLPLLANALAGAGCVDAELLAHLRGPGPHVRGCWAVDLVLDKK